MRVLQQLQVEIACTCVFMYKCALQRKVQRIIAVMHAHVYACVRVRLVCVSRACACACACAFRVRVLVVSCACAFRVRGVAWRGVCVVRALRVRCMCVFVSDKRRAKIKRFAYLQVVSCYVFAHLLCCTSQSYDRQ